MLDGRTAIVTGAGRGIGAAIARALDAAGARVALVARSVDQLEATAATLANGPVVVPADLATPDGPDSAVATALDAFGGRIDVLVNNAGIRVNRDFGDYSRDDFQRGVGVNLAAPFFASQAVVPIMKRQGGGRIIHIASQLARVTYAQRALYGLTKAALVHLTKSMAYELGVHNIVVNSISPGPVKTQPVLDRMERDPEEAARRVKNYMPAGRFGETWEIADLALYLATTEATFLQGEDICIDGGYTIH